MGVPYYNYSIIKRPPNPILIIEAPNPFKDPFEGAPILIIQAPILSAVEEKEHFWRTLRLQSPLTTTEQILYRPDQYGTLP